MERIKNYFAEQGLSAADIPRAIILHEVISVAMAATSWAVFYAALPSPAKVQQSLDASAAAGRQHAALQKAYSTAMARAQRSVSNWTWLRKVPGVGGNTGRLTASLAASTCFRAAIKPATVPFKLWAAWRLLLVCKQRMPGAFGELQVPGGSVARGGSGKRR